QALQGRQLAANALRADRDGAGGEQQRAAAAPGQGPGGLGQAPVPDLSKVSARKNLNETAFFFPQVLAEQDGTVKLQFTMPEAVTRWKFLAFAHDKDLRSGALTDHAVTARELMVQP